MGLVSRLGFGTGLGILLVPRLVGVMLDRLGPGVMLFSRVTTDRILMQKDSRREDVVCYCPVRVVVCFDRAVKIEEERFYAEGLNGLGADFMGADGGWAR